MASFASLCCSPAVRVQAGEETAEEMLSGCGSNCRKRPAVRVSERLLQLPGHMYLGQLACTNVATSLSFPVSLVFSTLSSLCTPTSPSKGQFQFPPFDFKYFAGVGSARTALFTGVQGRSQVVQFLLGHQTLSTPILSLSPAHPRARRLGRHPCALTESQA